jgi:hypothetical protein
MWIRERGPDPRGGTGFLHTASMAGWIGTFVRNHHSPIRSERKMA